MDNLTEELENIGKAADEISELALSTIGRSPEEVDLIIEQIKRIRKKYGIE